MFYWCCVTVCNCIIWFPLYKLSYRRWGIVWLDDMNNTSSIKTAGELRCFRTVISYGWFQRCYKLIRVRLTQCLFEWHYHIETKMLKYILWLDISKLKYHRNECFIGYYTGSEENTPKISNSTVFVDFLEQLFDYSKDNWVWPLHKHSNSHTE